MAKKAKTTEKEKKKKGKGVCKREYLKITERTYAWFETLFSREQKEAFLNDRNLFAIGAVFSGIACGRLIFRNTGSYIQIIDIFVHERFRNYGLGRGMLRFLLKYAFREKIPVIAYFSDVEGDERIKRFLNKDRLFSIKKVGGFYCRTRSADVKVKELLDLNKKHSKDFSVHMFSSLSPETKKAFFERRYAAGDYMAREAYGKKRLRRFCLYASKGRKINAVVFASLRPDKNIELDYLWGRKGAASSAIFLLSEEIKRVIKSKKDLYIYIAAVSPVTEKIVERLLPKREILKRYYRAIFDQEKVYAGIRAIKKKNKK